MYIPVFPDYDNSILNITATLQRHFGCPSFYAPLDVVADALAPRPRNVVLMIFDGMGDDMLQKNLVEKSFFRRHQKRTLTSVCPSTTTAALTALYSGLSPIEHGWLGWSLYFKEYGAAIDVFPNRYSSTKSIVGGKIDAAYNYMPYTTIFEQIHEVNEGRVACHTVIPSHITFPKQPNINHRVDSLDDLCAAVEHVCHEDGEKLILSYWHEPDAVMHQYGCYAGETAVLASCIDDTVARMAQSLPSGTLLIITADHGQLDITDDLFLNDMPELDECLVMPPDIEARTLGFTVHSDKMDLFPTRFADRFGDRYLLLDRKQVLDMALLGRGTPHPKSLDFIGDYLACALDTSMLRYRVRGGVPPRTYQGLHAGLDAREMLVPLILLQC